MAQQANNVNVLEQLRQFGYSDKEIISAIRQASNPNDINQIMDIIVRNQYKSEPVEKAEIKEQVKPINNNNNNNIKEVVLPPGWQQCRTKDGKVFYQNHNNQTTHWHIPDQAYWEECYTKDGRIYYLNHKDKTFHCELPKGIKLSKLAQTGPSKSNYKSSLVEPHQYDSNQPNKQQIPMVNNNNNKPKQKKDKAYWEKLGFQCGLTGDMTPLITEMLNSEEYKNASVEEQQMIKQQMELQRQRMEAQKQQMMIQQMNNQQRRNNMTMQMGQEMLDRQYVFMRNMWREPGDPYYVLEKKKYYNGGNSYL